METILGMTAIAVALLIGMGALRYSNRFRFIRW